jgi:hypothetical protein
MNNPNEYSSGTLSEDKLSVIRYNSVSGQHEWQLLTPVVTTTKKKTVKDDEITVKP